jgi:hypothetical protein
MVCDSATAAIATSEDHGHESFVAQWEAGGGSVFSGRSVWLSVGGGLTLFVAVGQMV